MNLRFLTKSRVFLQCLRLRCNVGSVRVSFKVKVEIVFPGVFFVGLDSILVRLMFLLANSPSAWYSEPGSCLAREDDAGFVFACWRRIFFG